MTLLTVLIMAGTSCQAQHGQDKAGGTSPATEAGQPAGPQQVDPAAAEKLMAEHADLQVLDVRTPEEVAGGTLKGAKVINWFDADFAQRASAELDKTKPVLVYCKVGGRSGQASDVLAQLGFTTIYNMTGGMSRWLSEGRPVQR